MLSTPPRSLNGPQSTSPTCVAEHPNTNTNSQEHKQESMNPRSCILTVGECTGRLMGMANTHLPFNDGPKKNLAKQQELAGCMSQLLLALLDTAFSLNLDLIRSIDKKMALNAKKYPVELCKGKAGKYTEYSDQTGVTRDNQSTQDDAACHTPISWQELATALPALVEKIADFARARKWEQYHTPRNICLALLGEVGELAELVQWKGDDDLKLEAAEIDKLSQELADVTIYLLRLVSQCHLVEEVCQGLKDLNTNDDDKGSN